MPSNASYWFYQVGWHPIFPRLHQRAMEASIPAGLAWDPFQFIELCERARRNPGSDLDSKALLVQRAEWQLLFDYCGRPQSSEPQSGTRLASVGVGLTSTR
jgi:hypothetical protein